MLNTQTNSSGSRRVPSVSYSHFASEVPSQGFAHIPACYYQREMGWRELRWLQESYETLAADPKGGNRYRSYSRFQLFENAFQKDPSNAYIQSKEYNYDHGGEVRNFEPIDNEILESQGMMALLRKDKEIAEQTGILDFTRPITVGLHQIRYRAEKYGPSYSSPVWLHKDDEDIVFVHLLSLAENTLGADNLISTGSGVINRVLRLSRPLETLVVGKKVFHAVTPMGSADGLPAVRDILLVTFAPGTEIQ